MKTLPSKFGLVGLALLLCGSSAGPASGDRSVISSLDTKLKPVGPSLKPYEGSVELTDMRTRYSKTFENSNGTRTWAASAGSVHFADQQGDWQDIDTEIRPLSAEPYAYGMTQNSYHSFFAPDASAPTVVKVQNGDYAVAFGIKGAQRGPVDLHDNTITYKNAIPGADLRFSTRADEISEEIILHHRPQNNVWEFDLNMAGVRLQTGPDGTLDFVDVKTGQRLWFMPKPFMFDAKGTRSEAVSKTLVQRWGRTFLVVKADESWLNNPTRSYPVTVDPTFSLSTSTGDCYLRSGSTATTGNGFGINVGFSSTGTVAARRSLIQWDMTGSPPQSAVVNAVTSVRVTLRQYTRTSGTTSASIGMYNVTVNWVETTATWASMSANFDTLFASTSCLENGDYSWQWNGNTVGVPVASRGVLLKNNATGGETTTAPSKTFNDKENTGATGAGTFPRLEIDYVVPGAPTATAPSAITVSSIQWNWTAGSPASGGFKVYDAAAAGTLKQTLATGVLSWNEAGLAANTSYQRWIAAYTGSDESARSTFGAKYTLSVAPTVSSMTVSVSSPCTLTWTAVGGFGAGTVQYYRYIWDQSPTHTWTDTETQWSSGTISTTPSFLGTWYLHVKGYNGDDVGNGTFDYRVGAGFTESMGTVGGTTAIATHESNNGFDNDDFTMTGTGDVRTTTPSTGYTGASGGANVFITTTIGLNFQIANINTVGLTSPQLSFGINKNTSAGDGSDLVVEVSSDGTTYTPLSFAALPTGSGWYLRTASGTIPATSNLRIRFRQTATTTQFRIDDVKLTAASGPASISAGGPTTFCSGGSVTLTASSGNSWSWSPGTGLSSTTDQAPTASPSSTTTYTVTVTDAFGCTAQASQTVTVDAVPTTAAAGSDQSVCGLAATLAGNTPTAGGGTWTKFSGPGTMTFSATDATTPEATATASVVGTYVLRWTITNGACTASSDDVQVIYSETPTTAAAGSDQSVCGLVVTLAGNTPTVGGGTWTKFSGPGTVTFSATDATTPGATATASDYGTYVLRWTISNGACTPSADDVQVTFSEAPTTAAAGSDQSVCGLVATLAGNTPAVGSGTWTKFSGPGTVTFSATDATTSGATATASDHGTYVLRWTISNGACTPSADDVQVIFSEAPTTAAAGSDQSVCGLVATLAGNTPAVGSGTWTKFSGPGTVTFSATDATTPGATATASDYGTYVLRWTISNGACTPSADEVQVIFSEAPTTTAAGSDQSVCGLAATLAGNTPTVGGGTWTKFSGPGTVAFSATDATTPGATATASVVGTYVLRWTITNGTCTASSDDLQVIYSETPTTAAAGNDQSVCSLSVTLAGNTPTVGGGTWTKVSGPGTVTFSATDATTPGATATASVVGTYVLRWTITNGACTASSDDVQITYYQTPSISTPPSATAVCSGSATNLSVIADGGGLTYAWRKRGTGWGSGNGWQLDAGSGGGSAGFFVASSSGNAGGSSGNIDTSSKSWGMFANGGRVAAAVRSFGPAMAVGQTLQMDMDNGYINNGATVGFGLQNSSGENIWEFYFVGGNSSYSVNAGSVSPSPSIGFTGNGLRITFTLTSASTYSVSVLGLNGGSSYGPFTGSLLSPGGGQGITRVRLFNANAGGGSDRDAYFNSISVGPYDDNAGNYTAWNHGDNFGNGPLANGGNISNADTASLSINPAAAGDAGSYDVVIYNSCGQTISSPVALTVNPLPTITLGANPAVCRGTTSANLTYSATTGSPDQYSIDFDGAAETAGFVDVSLASLPASPIVITVPGGAAAGTYNATLTVKNANGCVSTGSAITVTVNALPTITLGANPAVCRGTTSANLTYSATSASPDQYSIDFDGTAEGQGFADVTLVSLPASPIVITVPGSAAAGTYNGTLTVKNSTTGCASSGTAITVTVNALPVGGADAFSTPTNTPVDITSAKLKLNDSGTGLSITGVQNPSAQLGTVSLSGPDGTVTYTPASGFGGTDTFTYTLSDANGCTATVTVTATVGNGTAQGANAVFTGTDAGDFVARFAGIPGVTYTVETSSPGSSGPWAKYGLNQTAPTDNSLGFGIGVFEVRKPINDDPSRYFRTVYPAY